MFSVQYFLCTLCATGAVLAGKPPVVPVDDTPSIITALFTDGNGRDSRADFTPGNWEFDGFAEWPIHRIKQQGSPAQCTYKGAKSGQFQIFGSGSVEISPPQSIADVHCTV
ncbi:hypothetical protein MN608_10052 [Microdochium nivale]|nr:hypothetical protein MN608_10052 [Microdochium nivale]